MNEITASATSDPNPVDRKAMSVPALKNTDSGDLENDHWSIPSSRRGKAAPELFRIVSWADRNGFIQGCEEATETR